MTSGRPAVAWDPKRPPYQVLLLNTLKALLYITIVVVAVLFIFATVYLLRPVFASASGAERFGLSIAITVPIVVIINQVRLILRRRRAAPKPKPTDDN
jgi:hypothetical protein